MTGHIDVPIKVVATYNGTDYEVSNATMKVDVDDRDGLSVPAGAVESALADLMAVDPRIDQIRALLKSFTDYEELLGMRTVHNHSYVDGWGGKRSFWDDLIFILDGTEPTPEDES